MRLFAVSLLTFVGTPAFSQEVEARHVDAMGREYFLYMPPRLDPAKTYWLVVGVHGAGGKGKGAGALADFVANGHCIVVGPTFPNGYQGLQNGSDKQLVDLFGELKQKFKLHDRLFVAGFSGGGQFSHRFALRHPQLVIGCASHGAGSWATGDLPFEKNALTDVAAAKVPFAISCGLRDTDKSVASSPLSRIDWAKKFAASLKDKGFLFRAEFYPAVGHQMTPAARALTDECFAISVTGMTPAGRTELEKRLAPIQQAILAQDFASASKRLATFDADFAKVRVKLTPKKEAAFEPGWSAGERIRDELEARAKAYVGGRVDELRLSMPKK